MISRLVASRGDVAAVWSNVARLQAAHGDTQAAAQSRAVAARVRGVNGWLRTTWRGRGDW